MNKFLIYLLILLSLSSFVFAVGDCSLNKYNYHPGENSVFTCFCTSPLEENQAGYLVWLNSTGNVLHSVAANSGPCRTISFGEQFIFPYGITNFTGNVTFSLNSDGTDNPIQWDDLTDVNYDIYNVSGASPIDCVITPKILDNESGILSVINLGEQAVLQFTVSDGRTGYTLTHAQCEAALIDPITGLTLLQEPSISMNNHHVETGAMGLGYIYHVFNEKTLTPSTLYEYKINCYCLNNSEEGCYYGDGGMGTLAGFKECVGEGIVLTGNDRRTYPAENQSLVLALGIFSFLLLYIAFKLEPKHFILQLLLVITSMICLMLISSVNASNFGNKGITFVKIGLWLLRLFFVYVTIYLVYEILKWKNIIGGRDGN